MDRVFALHDQRSYSDRLQTVFVIEASQLVNSCRLWCECDIALARRIWETWNAIVSAAAWVETGKGLVDLSQKDE